MVQRIAAEAEIGKIYKGTVRKVVDFGAFVEILPGTDGLVHISQLAHERVRKVSDVLKEGDVIDVKVLEVDRSGKIRLSRKETLRSRAPATRKPGRRPHAGHAATERRPGPVGGARRAPVGDRRHLGRERLALRAAGPGRDLA